MRSAKLLALTVLAVVLALSSAQNVFASPVEIAYDSGIVVYNNVMNFAGVRFSLPSGVSSAQLVTVRYAWVAAGDPVVIHVTGADHLTELTTPISTSSGAGTFTDLDVSSRGIVVSGDFFVVLQYVSGVGNHRMDGNANVGRSFIGDTLAGLTVLTSTNILLRVVVDPIAEAVGGEVASANMSALVAPWLAVIGVIACISTAVVVRKKRRQ